MRLPISALAVLLLFSFGSFAQEKPDLSGYYVLAWPKPELRHGKRPRPSQLKVVQHGRVLKATFTERGKTRTSTYYLDGAESKNVAGGGAPSTDRAKIKYKTLLIESIVRVRKTTLEIEQKWQLSIDSRHLIIQITASVSSAAFPLGSWEHVYTRQPQRDGKIGAHT
jgi:hypothetical protein